MTKVAAVVVTFNRKALVAECLQRLIDQTRPIDRIYVIDNHSGDGTEGHLRRLGILDHPALDYVRLDSNSGGAGGFYEGMRRAHEAGFDWIWLMDDDGEPATDALALMEPQFADPSVAVVLPMIADAVGEPDFQDAHRSFLRPAAEIRGFGVARPLGPEDIAGRATVDVDLFSFVGPCFRRSVIDAAGLPRREFFIHYDDIEYALRIRALGLGRAVVVTAARILHKEAQAVDLMEERRAFGRTSRRHRFDKLWLRYFGYRNYTHLVWSGTIPASRARFAIEHLRTLPGILLYDDQKWRRLRFWNAAFLDGVRGHFDNGRPARILGRKRS